MSAHSNGTGPHASMAVHLKRERTINIAIGMVMELLTVDVDEAREILVEESVRSGHSVAQVAGNLVETGALRQAPDADV